jgi:hypothetical protein
MTVKTKKVTDTIIENHIVKSLANVTLINVVFEEVDVLKAKRHIDNPNMLSLMFEFIGPFKKKKTDDEAGEDLEKNLMAQKNGNLAKNVQKNVKHFLSNAQKATSALKSVDLTNPTDVNQKVKDVAVAVQSLGDIEKDLVNVAKDAGVTINDLVPVEMQNQALALYGLAAHSLNAVKASVDLHLKSIEQSVHPGSMQLAKSRHAQSQSDRQAKDDLKGVMTPWHKQIGSMIGAAGQGAAMGAPGSMRMREEDESLESVEETAVAED